MTGLADTITAVDTVFHVRIRQKWKRETKEIQEDIVLGQEIKC
jgi:hypothetical protein